jgi:MFS family permease
VHLPDLLVSLSVLSVTSLFYLLSSSKASAISTYTIGILTMTRDLNCSTFEATVGLSVYPLGFSLVPLLTSSLSEEFGRFRLYIISSLLFMLTHVMIALYSQSSLPAFLHANFQFTEPPIYKPLLLLDYSVVPSAQQVQHWLAVPSPIYGGLMSKSCLGYPCSIKLIPSDVVFLWPYLQSLP